MLIGVALMLTGLLLAVLVQRTRRLEREVRDLWELSERVGVIDTTQKLMAEDIDRLERDVTDFTRKI